MTNTLNGHDEKAAFQSTVLAPPLMFSFAALLCPIITAGFQEPLNWEKGLDEEIYNLQSEPTFYNSYLAVGFKM